MRRQWHDSSSHRRLRFQRWRSRHALHYRWHVQRKYRLQNFLDPFTIVGLGNVTFETGGISIDIDDSPNITLTNFEVDGSGADGITANSITSLTLVDIVFSKANFNFLDGLRAFDAGDIVLNLVEASSNGESGIDVDTSDSLTVIDSLSAGNALAEDVDLA